MRGLIPHGGDTVVVCEGSHKGRTATVVCESVGGYWLRFEDGRHAVFEMSEFEILGVWGGGGGQPMRNPADMTDQERERHISQRRQMLDNIPWGDLEEWHGVEGAQAEVEAVRAELAELEAFALRDLRTVAS